MNNNLSSSVLSSVKLYSDGFIPISKVSSIIRIYTDPFCKFSIVYLPSPVIS